jgi:hypothetical protein
VEAAKADHVRFRQTDCQLRPQQGNLLIDKNGEGQVLFDLRPPGGELAEWAD